MIVNKSTDAKENPAPPAPPGIQSAEDEHRIIRGHLETLERATELSVIEAAIEALQRMLPQHFRSEEGPGGLYEELRLLSPGLDAPLRRLCDDHLAIADQLMGLLELIAAARTVLDELTVAKRAFVDHARQHEGIERKLLADAYYVDLGFSF